VFFSPDSKFVISSGKDKTVRIWDATTGDAIQRSPGVSCEGSPAAFSPDGGFIATASNRNINITKVQK
jgi:WD40 repeat protein